MTRAPAHLSARRVVGHDDAVAMLLRTEQTHRNNAWAAVVGGGLLCLLSVLVLTVLYLLIFGSVGGWGFRVTYVVVALVGLPLLFLLAYKLQGSVLEATVPGSDLLQTRIVGRQVIPLLAAVEVANVGPRLVLWGVAQLRSRSVFGTMGVDRLADAMALLAGADGAVSPARLLAAGEQADALEPILGLLLYFGLADLSKNADRVWATTEAKRKLGLPT